MKIVRATDADAAAWDAYVASSTTATFYHQYRWRQALHQAYGIATIYLAAQDEAGAWRGILPLALFSPLGGGRTLLSLPFANYGGIVADSPVATNALLDAARELLGEQHAQYLELKHVSRLDHPALVDKLHYHSLELPLMADPEALWEKSLNTKARNQVRKARKEGVTAATGRQLLPQFIAVYRRHLRDLGTPTHGMRWFQALEHILGDEMDVVVASADGQPVAGAWLFYFKDIAILHAAASLSAYNKRCPNNLVYWTAIELACRRGCRVIDFARSRIGSGTYHFKSQWGATPRQTYYQYILNTAKSVPDMDPHNPAYSRATRIWSRLPLPVANAFGPWLRKRITT